MPTSIRQGGKLYGLPSCSSGPVLAIGMAARLALTGSSKNVLSRGEGGTWLLWLHIINFECALRNRNVSIVESIWLSLERLAWVANLF